MAIVRVQHTASAPGVFSTTASESFGSASTAGNLLIAIVSCSVSTVTASAPSGFTLAIQNTNANSGTLALFYRANAPSTTTISSSLSAGDFWAMAICEYSGLLTSSVLDQTGSGTTTGTVIPSGSLTTSFTNTLIVTGMNDLNGDTIGPLTSSFTDVEDVGDTRQNGVLLGDLMPSSAGNYSTTGNSRAGGNGVIASFLSSGSSGSGTPGNAILFGSTF